MTEIDSIYQLCNQIIKNDFNNSFVYFDTDGTLSTMNRSHTAMIKIKLNLEDMRFKTPVYLSVDDFKQGIIEFNVLDNPFKKSEFKSLHMFDKELFNKNNYGICSNTSILRKLILSHKLGNNKDFCVKIRGREGVYDTHWTMPCFLNIPLEFKLKILDNKVLCINYDFYGFNVYSCIAAKLVSTEDMPKLEVD